MFSLQTYNIFLKLHVSALNYFSFNLKTALHAKTYGQTAGRLTAEGERLDTPL